MYQEFFKLKELPYQITPDHRYLFLSSQHNSALNRGQYVIQDRRGLAVIYGDIGMGKTTIARRLHERCTDMGDAQVATLITPALRTPNQFLLAIMDEFQVPPKRSYGKSLVAFGDFLIESHGSKKLNTVLIVDEAQKLTYAMLDVLHSILNYESDTEKLVQIVLIGQRELADVVDSYPAVKNRVYSWGKLEPLTPDDTNDLIAFRWHAASGGQQAHPFTDKALELIYIFSRGVPRDIVKLCNEALEEAAAIGSNEVTEDMVIEAAKVTLSPRNYDELKHTIKEKDEV